MSFFNKINKEFNQHRKTNTEEVRFESGMTSEQKFNAISESVLATINHTKQSLKGCAMHPKISKRCRKCQQIQAKLQKIQKEEVVEVEEHFPEMIKINTNNMKSHFSQKLQKNVQDAHLFKHKLRPINNVRDLVNDLTSDQISLDAYITASTDTPTPFFCYFYRLAELRPTKEQLTIMLRANNVNVRSLALLYLRTYADPTLVYGCLCNSFKDNKLISTVTVGEYAMRLFDEEQLNHGGFRLPRLPIKFQRAIDKRIATIKAEREQEFERERERSREKERTRREYQEQDYRARREQQTAVVYAPSPTSQPSGTHQSQPQVSLKQRIRQLQEKKLAQARKRAVLQSYKSEKVNQLLSEEEAYSQNDEVQKFKVG